MAVAYLVLAKNFCVAFICLLLFTVVAQGQYSPQVADQPIDINADQLEIQQERNLAIFRGNVVAEQGHIKLRAEQLKVWYRQSSETSSPDDIMTGGTIIRIDAIDQVFISSASETAKGDIGIYEIEKQRLTLTGTVILTRGDNVLRGKKLVMDMATGQSQLSGGRVHGRFVAPKQKKEVK